MNLNELFLKPDDCLCKLSKKELMSFVKECCIENDKVYKSISKYEACILEWAKKVDDFIVFTVNAGNDEHITVSINQKTMDIYCLEHYVNNYSGYDILLKDGDDKITQNTGYGFGSWVYKKLNLDLSEYSSNSKQSYGCCCG